MPHYGHDTSPMCQLEGSDRRTPFSLEGVPTITAKMERFFKEKEKPKKWTMEELRRQIRRATAELRRRYDEYGERALRTMLAEEREYEELTRDY